MSEILILNNGNNIKAPFYYCYQHTETGIVLLMGKSLWNGLSLKHIQQMQICSPTFLSQLWHWEINHSNIFVEMARQSDNYY